MERMSDLENFVRPSKDDPRADMVEAAESIGVDTDGLTKAQIMAAIDERLEQIPAAEAYYESLAEEPQEAVSAPFPANLVLGSRGEHVMAVQRRLSLEPTGSYDRPLARAVMNFQRQRGLYPSGNVDRATRKALSL